MIASLRLIPRASWLWSIVLLFAVHTTCYLYFFVDDEGITLVYARHFVEGRGLTYAPSEEPSEGYSNFLHLIVMAGVVAVVEGIGLSPMWAFVSGGLWSLVCGAALVMLTWRTAERCGVPLLPRAAATLMLALSGPLAVWSNSSLETVPFALAVMILIAATVPDVHPKTATIAAIVVALLRIDGLLVVSMWLAARMASADTAVRRTLLRSVAAPVIGLFSVYVLARAWYFSAWLPLPLQTKVAHKLMSRAGTVVWSERHRYLYDFVSQAGWPMLAGLAFALGASWRAARARPLVKTLALALTGMLTYVGIVGDWMFGFRFLVPLLAPMALLFGVGLSLIRRQWVTRLVIVGGVACAVVGAVRFSAAYQASQRRPLFWAAPSLDPARRFGEYYEAYRALQPIAHPGMLLAFHEAGFVPFMLGVENVDMLGLTSTFAGSAPGLDAVHTDVGRYYPLRPEPAHHAVHAYLAFREPHLIVVRQTWMHSANNGRLPPEILNGYYALANTTPAFAIYRRTARAINPRRREAEGFLENLAHPAYADAIAVNDVPVLPQAALAELPPLWQGVSREIVASPSWTLHIRLRDDATPVHEIFIEAAPPSGDARLDVRLVDSTGRLTGRVEEIIRMGAAVRMQRFLDTPANANAISVRITSVTGEPVTVGVHTIRIMGQSPRLRDHVARHGID